MLSINSMALESETVKAMENRAGLPGRSETLDVVLIDSGVTQIQGLELALLMQRGLSVRGWAFDAEDGVRQVLRCRPHAVVMTWSATAPELISQLRQLKVGQLAPRLIVVTDGDGAAGAAKGVGADAVLPQNNLGHHLGRVIRELVCGHESLIPRT